jgi:hypothetical protein
VTFSHGLADAKARHSQERLARNTQLEQEARTYVLEHTDGRAGRSLKHLKEFTAKAFSEAPQGVHGQNAVCVTSRVWRVGADYPESNPSTEANESHPSMPTAQRCGAEGNAARTGGSESI